MNNEAKAYKVFVNQGLSTLAIFDVESIRIKNERLHAVINKQLVGTFNGTARDDFVPTKTADIPITIYAPTNASNDNMVIYIHGGGWMFGSRTTHQTIVKMAAEQTKSIWITVEYRLAPEHKFPTWLDDSLYAVRHIIANKTKYGGSTSAKIGVAGDSAGAISAASICLTLKDSIDFQILIYGSFDLINADNLTDSDKEFNKDPFLSRTVQLEWICTNAFVDPVTDVSNPRVSILRNDRSLLANLPPTLFIVAEIDPARDDSYAYHKILQSVGVKSKLHLIKGVLHSFFSLPGLYRQACKEAIDIIRTFMENLDA